jgi:outer membrane protein TolC
MRQPILGGAACAVALAGVVTVVRAAEPLTLPRAQDLIRMHAPEIIAARTALNEARGARAGATPLFASNPSITGGAGLVAQPDGWRPQDWGAGGAGSIALQVPVEIAGQRGLRIGAADARIEAQRMLALDATRQAMFAGTVAYYGALHAARVADLTDAFLAVSRRLHEIAGGLRDRGLGSAIDVDLAGLDVSEVAQTNLAAQTAAERLRAELLAFLGLAPDAFAGLVGDLLTSAPLPSLDDALQRAANRTDVRALKAERFAALRQASLADADAFPTPILGAQYQYQHQVPAPQHMVLAQVTFPLPVFSRGQGEAGRSRARASGLAEQQDQAVLTAQAQVRAAFSILLRIREARATLPKSPTDELTSRLEKSYAQRVVDLNTVLNLQRRLLQSRRASLELDLQEVLARVWLDAAMGDLQ